MGRKKLYHEKMSEAQCIRILRRMRHAGGQARCPDCGSARHWRYERPDGFRRYVCRKCRRKFSDFSGTVFERTRTPLRKWFKAIDMFLYLDLNATKLMIAIEVTYKTAWRMLHKLREAMRAELEKLILEGDVEIDDTYIGGRRKGRRGRGAAGKSVVVGMVSRLGKIFLKTAPNLGYTEIADAVIGRVDDNARIITDEFKGYRILDMLEFEHSVVNHSVGFGSNGNHTNSIEGLFSLIKRVLRCRYLGFKHKYLPNYLAEFCFRRNHDPDIMSFDLLALCSVQRRG
jgi:transposase-like protein